MRSALLAALLAGAAALPAAAGAPMSSASSSLPRQSVDAGGGSPQSSANNALDSSAAEQPSGLSNSTNYRLQSGAWELFSFPGAVHDLSDAGDVTLSSASLKWTAPGYDGALGSLQSGSSYYVRVASYTAPDTFDLADAQIVISTEGVNPGDFVSTPAVSGLIPNTTYFATLWTLDARGDASFMSNMSTFTTLARPATPDGDPDQWKEVDFTSVTVTWGGLPLSPPDASSMTAEGWVIEASSTNFGALAPGGVISSSTTYDVKVTTLTVSQPPLVTNKLYYFRAGSLNWSGGADYVLLGSTQTHLQAQDPAPTAPAFLSVSSYAITAQWDPNGNATGTKYTLETSLDSGFGPPVTSSNTYNLFASTSGLSANTTYWFEVDASTTGSTSNFVSLGATVTLTPPPAAPAAPFAGVFTTSASVVWLAGGNPPDVSTYTIVFSTENAAPQGDAADVSLSTVPAGGQPAATVTGLTPNTTYFAWVDARNWLGASSGWIALGSTVTYAAYPGAAAPGISDVQATFIGIEWLPNGNPVGVTTYTVVATTQAYPNSDAGNVTLATAPAGAIAAAMFTQLIPNVTYFFYASAVDFQSRATPFVKVASTATLSVFPTPPPGDPFSSVSMSGFSVSWTSGTISPVYNAPGTTYYIQIATSSTFYPVIAQSFEFSLSSAVANLSLDTTYWAQVAAYDVHDATWTAFSLLGDTPTWAAPPAAAAQPFLDVGQSSMTVEWDTGGNTLVHTTYTAVLTPQTPYPNASPLNVSLSTTPTGSPPSAELTGLSPNTTYYLDVAAQNHVSVQTSFTETGSTATYSQPPGAPSVSDVELSSLTVSWQAVASAGYDLKASSTNFGALTPGGTISLSSTSDAGAGSLSVGGLDANTTYFFHVGAYNWRGALSYVDLSSASTLAPPVSNPTVFKVYDTSVTVTWTPCPAAPQSSSCEGYEVDAATADLLGNSDFGGTLVSSITYNRASTTLVVTGLDPGTTFALRVGALNHAGVPDYAVAGASMTNVTPMTWVGGGGNSNWYNAANWSPRGVPSAGTPVTIAMNVSVTVSASSPSISFSSLTLGSPAGGVAANLWLATSTAKAGSLLVYSGAGLTVASTQTLVFNGDVTLVSGSSVTQAAVTQSPADAGIALDAAGTFDLQSGALIDADGLGFPGGAAQAAGTGSAGGGGGGASANHSGGGGGGHGGAGGAGTSGAGGAANDAAIGPALPGAGGGGGKSTGNGGGAGGPGGGYVNVSASSMAINGRIQADGTGGFAATDSGGGGAGGAIQLTATYFSGAGVVESTGGAGGGTQGGGGGGGIVSISITGSGNTCDLGFAVGGGTSGATGGSIGVVSTTVTLATPSLTVISVDSMSIQWGWTQSHGAKAYQVFSSTGGNGQSAVLGPGTTYFVESPLLGNTTYTRYVRVSACGAFSDSAQLAQSTLASPIQPLPASFVAVGETSIQAGWAALPASPQSATSEGYVVEASSRSDFAATVFSSTTYSAAASTLTVSGLLRNTTYFFRAASLNWSGGESGWVSISSISTLAPLPSAAASLFTGVWADSVSVQWTGLPASPQEQSGEGYVVEASSTDFGALLPVESSFASSATPNLSLTALQVSGLDLANTYYFRVGSLNWNGVPNYFALGRLNFQVTPSQTGLSFGSIDMSAGPTSVVNPTGVTVSNVGNWPATLLVWADTATAPSSPWTLGTTPDNDVPVLEGLFNSALPAAGSFVTPLTASTVTATGTILAGDQTAVSIPSGQSRVIWFRFFTPTTTSSTSKETLRVHFTPRYP